MLGMSLMPRQSLLNVPLSPFIHLVMDLSLKSTRGFLLIDEFGGTIRLLQVEEVVLDVSSTGR